MSSDFKICQQLMNVNCLSPIALIKGFLPKFIAKKDGQIVNVLSVAAQVGTPMRTFYSTSKFSLDGFGKALQAEVSPHNISVLQCYPAYVQTNISRNALIGEGKKLGKTDSNIENGIPVDEACEDLIKAIYTRRAWITLGSTYYQILPKLPVFLGEKIAKKLFHNNYKQQMAAINEAR